MTKKMITATIVMLAILFLPGVGSATDQIAVDPSTVLSIDVGTTGHYKLTLTTNVDPIGGNLDWASDNSLVWANIGAAPTGQFGAKGITTSSACSGSGLAMVCTQDFDLQVMPQSGITLNVLHDVTVTYKTANGVAKAMATASGNPVPELSAGILTGVGLIGLLGLVRRKRNN
jgi:hypothetical protein